MREKELTGFAWGRQRVGRRRWGIRDKMAGAWQGGLGAIVLILVAGSCRGELLYETKSEYQHIRVIQQGGVRYLNFDGARETRMSVRNPLQGHFEYIEYFHMPWLWNPSIERALMIGLGGGSIQRQYLSYYPQVRVDSVEIDPEVVKVAKEYFNVPENKRHQIHVRDGRAFLENTQKNFDLIIMDAYGGDAAGDSIPYRLATREFFQAGMAKLNPNGVMAYNVMGTLVGWRARLLGTIYRTMSSVFPQVYLFPARSSRNVVLIGTRDPRLYSVVTLQSRATQLIQSGNRAFTNFRQRLFNFRVNLPSAAPNSPILTDRMVSRRDGNPIPNQESSSGTSTPSDRSGKAKQEVQAQRKQEKKPNKQKEVKDSKPPGNQKDSKGANEEANEQKKVKESKESKKQEQKQDKDKDKDKEEQEKEQKKQKKEKEKGDDSSGPK